MDTAPASLFSAHALSVFPATLNEASGSLLHAGADRTDNEPVVSDIEALGAGQNEPNDGAAQQSSSLGLALLLGGDKPSSSSRPVAPIIDTLLEAAHYRHQMRNLKHPFTYNYSMFEWRMQEAGQSSRHAASNAGLPHKHRRSSAPSSEASTSTIGFSPGTLRKAPPSLLPSLSPSQALLATAARGSPGAGGSQQDYSSGVDGVGGDAGEWAAGGNAGGDTSGGEDWPTHTAGTPPSSQPGQSLTFLSGLSPGSVSGSRGGHHRRNSSLEEGSLSGSEGGPASTSYHSQSPRGLLPFGGGTHPSASGPPGHGALLEVICEYDAHFQASDIWGQQGPPVRPGAHVTIGPVAWLFRWYAKRGTLFSGQPTAADLADAPPLPPLETLRPESGRRASAATSGRRLNRAPDPVMNYEEIVDMLEDFEVVPKWVTRQDVAHLFRAAASVRCDPPSKLQRSSMQPADLRFPQFCDLLIRIALAAAARREEELANALPKKPIPSPTIQIPKEDDSGSGRASAEGEGSILGGAADPSASGTQSGPRKLAAAALALGGAPPPKHLIAALEAEKTAGPRAALKALMDALELTHPTHLILRQKLDALARMAADRGPRKKAIKWMYVASAQNSALDAFKRATPAPGLGGWGVATEGVPAPAFLRDLLLGEDKAAGTQYVPCWRAFREPAALNCGTMQPGELRMCRVVLFNRGQQQMHVRMDATAAPWLRATFNEGPLVPGVPRVIDVALRFPEMGEYTGELRVVAHIKRNGEAPRLTSIPIYALVGLPDPSRKVPTAKSMRSGLATKAAAGGALRPPPLHPRSSLGVGSSMAGSTFAASAASLGAAAGAAWAAGSMVHDGVGGGGMGGARAGQGVGAVGGSIASSRSLSRALSGSASVLSGAAAALGASAMPMSTPLNTFLGSRPASIGSGRPPSSPRGGGSGRSPGSVHSFSGEVAA